MAGTTFDSNFHGTSLFEPMKFYCIINKYLPISYLSRNESKF